MKNLMKFAFIGLLSLSACGGLMTSNQPVTRTWMLMPLEKSVQTVASGVNTKVIVSVGAVPGLDTDRILTLSEEAELNSFDGARWAEHTPEMFESLVVRTLQGSGGIVVVSSQADCDLRLEVQEFFIYTGSSESASEARIVLNGQYSCRAEQAKPIHLQASIPVHEDKMSTIVAAFQTGIDQLMASLLDSISS